MDSLTKTLLTSAALSALSVAPAMAATQSHHPMLSLLTKNGAITLKGDSHFKSALHVGGAIKSTINYTATTCGGFGTYGCGKTWHATGNESTLYKKTVDLATAVIFYEVSAGGHCVDYQPQAQKITAKPTNGKASLYSVKQHVTLSSCTGTLTYYGPAYELKSKTATSDSEAIKDYLTDTYTTTTTGKKHKKKKHELIENINIYADVNIDH